tara:strand:+ start:412 stop:534 length:123 start_codon:yes stop_codon:yes gene_type:complete
MFCGCGGGICGVGSDVVVEGTSGGGGLFISTEVVGGGGLV